MPGKLRSHTLYEIRIRPYPSGYNASKAVVSSMSVTSSRTVSPSQPVLRDPAARFGAHMPISGGLHNAVFAGRDAGCDLIQVFTKSPQQWKAREVTDEQVEQFLAAQEETGIPCVAAH